MTYISNFSSGTFKESPEAVVTVNRNRLKQYSGSYYIKNETNFELEIFNPCSFKIGAQITLQGVNIGMILVKPGERIYLDRFINENKKFLFTTYDVGFNNASLNAIKDNGNLKISFFKEPDFTLGLLSGTINTSVYYTNQVFNQPSLLNIESNSTMPYMSTTTYSNGTNTLNTSGSVGCTLTNTGLLSNQNNSVRHNYTEKNITPKDFQKAKSKNFRTGIVEKGSASNQSLTTTYGNYTVYINEITYKLLPYENRPVEATEIRKYCTSCGVRIKKPTWKFCPDCGEKID